MSDSSTARPVSITLIHGTWGAGFFSTATARFLPHSPRWYEDGAPFRQSFDAALAEIRGQVSSTTGIFKWSGANSVIERDKAARQLAAQLDQQHADSPDVVQILIGHSHGGSVAMLACKFLQRAQPAVVTLATPFVELDSSDVPDRYSWIRFWTDRARVYSLAFVSLAWGMVLCGVLATLAVNGLGIETGSITLTFPYTQSLQLLPYAWLHPNWVPVLFAAPFAVIGYRSGQRWIENSIHPFYTIGGLTQVKPSIRMLVLRGVDDEATLVLAAGAIGNRLSQPVVRGAVVIAFLAAVLGSLSLLFPSTSSAVISEIKDTSAWALRIALALVLGVELLAGLCKSVYGRELFLWSLWQQVRSHSAPDHADNLTVLTLPYKGRRTRMRHAIYNHVAVAPILRNWIRALATNDMAKAPKPTASDDFLRESSPQPPQAHIDKDR